MTDSEKESMRKKGIRGEKSLGYGKKKRQRDSKRLSAQREDEGERGGRDRDGGEKKGGVLQKDRKGGEETARQTCWVHSGL